MGGGIYMKRKMKLEGNNINFKEELIAALTSFFSVVYIVVVNSAILFDGGIPLEGAIIATVLACASGCLLMGILGRVPVILVPGMGVNALFSYTIIKSMGLSPSEALAVVFLSGIIFLVIAFTKIGEELLKSIPDSLKEAIGVGIGILITFIGFQKSGVIISDPSTFVALGDIRNPQVYTTLINLLFTLFLFVRGVKGSFLFGIIGGTIISYLFGGVDLSQMSLSLFSLENYKSLFFSMDFRGVSNISFWIGVFSITLVLVFENIGLLHGQVNVMLNKEGRFKDSFKACAISAILSGVFGTSPTVVAIEGATGITSGGKSGWTSIFTGILFLTSLFFIPFIKIIPNSAIAPILIIVGSLMLTNILNIPLKDFEEGFPAFLTIVTIPLTFSIVDGMAFGFIVYPLIKIMKGKGKKVNFTMYIISAMFLMSFLVKVFI
nr:NCS2 family permease [uncultured Clostridium sp.]